MPNKKHVNQSVPHPMLDKIQKMYDQHPDRLSWENNKNYPVERKLIKIKAGTLMVIVDGSPPGLSKVIKEMKGPRNGYTGELYKTPVPINGKSFRNFPTFLEGMSTRDYLLNYLNISANPPYTVEACIDNMGSPVQRALDANTAYTIEVERVLSHWQPLHKLPCAVYDPDFPEVLEEVL